LEKRSLDLRSAEKPAVGGKDGGTRLGLFDKREGAQEGGESTNSLDKKKKLLARKKKKREKKGNCNRAVFLVM